MVSAEDVIEIYQVLSGHGIHVWLTGGWGIDALLGEQTRPHHDLDVIMLLDDIAATRALLETYGYGLKELWSENRFALGRDGSETATAFYLEDAVGRQFDAHAVCLDDQGNGIPMWQDDEGIIFHKQDLAGEGRVAGIAVRCVSPEMQSLRHTGYELPDKQLGDLERLHAKFGVAYPPEYYRQRSSGV